MPDTPSEFQSDASQTRETRASSLRDIYPEFKRNPWNQPVFATIQVRFSAVSREITPKITVPLATLVLSATIQTEL